MKKLCLALVLLLSGCSYGITNTVRDTHNYEKIEKMELLDEFNKIDADSEFSDVVLKTGKAFEISTEFYGARWKPEFSVKDGTLHVDVIDTMPRVNNWNANKSNKIVITYPEKTQFSDVVIKNEFGNLNASDLNADKINLYLSYADYELKDSAWQEYVVNFSFSDGSMDNITLNKGSFTMDYSTLDAATLQAETMECNNSFSTITSKNTQLKNFTFNGEYSDLDMDKATVDHFDYVNQFATLTYQGEILKECKVESSYGDVDFTLKQAESDFKFDLYADMADINVNGSVYDKHIRMGDGLIPFNLELEFADANIDTN